MSEETTSSPNPRNRTRRGLIIALVLGLGAIVVVPMAMAGSAVLAAGHGAWAGHCRGGDITAETVRERMDFASDIALTRVDATDDQRAEVDAILDELAPALFAQKQQGAELHGEFAAALSGDEVDADALEALRQAGLEHADEATKILIDGVVDVANVLTAEQRAELIDHAQRMHERWSK